MVGEDTFGTLLSVAIPTLNVIGDSLPKESPNQREDCHVTENTLLAMTLVIEG